MGRPILADGFAHHVWATLRLVDACLKLPEDQLGVSVPGTYGSIIDTMRHIVDSDGGYLFTMTGDRRHFIDPEQMNLADLRAPMESYGPVWARILEQEADPDKIVIRHREDGSESHTTVGIRLAQVLHHGTDHRSQIATALTSLGIEPPPIDVWAYADETGRSLQLQPGEPRRSLSL